MPFCFLRSGPGPSIRRFLWIFCAVWSCDCQQPNTEFGAGAGLIGLLFECFYLLREQAGKDVLIGHPLLCFCFLLAIGDRLLRVSTPPTTHTIRSYGTYVYPILLEPYDHRFRLGWMSMVFITPTSPSVVAMGVMWRGHSWDIHTIILIIIINPVAFYDL